MRYVICSIRDAKTEAFMEPMFFQHPAQAVRSFSDAVNAPVEKSDFAKHPEDYTLFQVGEWYPVTGEVRALEQPLSLAVGVNLRVAV